MNGLLLSLQFFTSIPVNKQLPLTRKDITLMYICLPLIGLLIGAAGFAAVSVSGAVHFGPLLTAVIAAAAMTAVTNGLHLDGFADTADAYYSFRDREKRLSIMDDPRIGAFGVMALLFLLAIKIALLHELLSRGEGALVFFLTVPLIARCGMNLFAAGARAAKEEGLFHFFAEKMNSRAVAYVSVLLLVAACACVLYWTGNVTAAVVLLLLPAAVAVLFRKWAVKHFGGVTGDLCGAYIEGTEVLLWLTVILCI